MEIFLKQQVFPIFRIFRIFRIFLFKHTQKQFIYLPFFGKMWTFFRGLFCVNSKLVASGVSVRFLQQLLLKHELIFYSQQQQENGQKRTLSEKRQTRKIEEKLEKKRFFTHTLIQLHRFIISLRDAAASSIMFIINFPPKKGLKFQKK